MRLLIVNPYATGVSKGRVEAVVRALGDVELRQTESRGHATELAREAVGAEAVYVFSGDGVFNEVLNGIDAETPVGFLPGGGANVLPRALGLPTDPVRAAQRVLLGRTRRISLGRVNGRRFAFAAGIGIDAEAIRAMETVKRKHVGRRAGDGAYVWEVTRRLLSGYETRLQLPGLGRASILLVSNGPVFTYLGRAPLRFSPQATWEGGLDLAAPEHLRAVSVPRLLGRVAAGRGLSGAQGVLSGHDLDRIEVVCESPMPLQADGEDLGDVTQVVFEAEREAVSVLV